MKFLLLLFVLFSFIDARIYRDNSKEIVIDDTAKLMWNDDTSVVKILKKHSEAQDYCKNLDFAGLKSWRLPEIEEYELIVDKKNIKNYINKSFKFNVPDGYWPQKAPGRTLWFYPDYMHFISGTKYFDSRHTNKYVRCVRNY